MLLPTSYTLASTAGSRCTRHAYYPTHMMLTVPCTPSTLEYNGINSWQVEVVLTCATVGSWSKTLLDLNHPEIEYQFIGIGMKSKVPIHTSSLSSNCRCVMSKCYRIAYCGHLGNLSWNFVIWTSVTRNVQLTSRVYRDGFGKPRRLW